ncbi:MAG: hypothetical protein R6U66_08425 [Bacteroidales bacterium]
MEFKKLDLAPENKGIKGFLKSVQFKRSLIAILIGAVAGFGYYFFSDAHHLDNVVLKNAFQPIFTGAFLGFFITNSPCARNQC